MSELTLTKGQIENSLGGLVEAVDTTFTESNGVYDPPKLKVPRPNFALFAIAATNMGLVARNGAFEVAPSNSEVLCDFAGLRGMGKFRLGQKTVGGPAVVLQGGKSLAILLAEQHGDKIDHTQHALLETEYAKQFSEVSREHSSRDATNAGEIGPALMVASSWGATRASNIHSDMHQLAAENFGIGFGQSGRQDFAVRHKTRRVIPAILPLSRAVLSIAEGHQLPGEEELFGLKLTADEMAVGMTLAAATSKRQTPNLRANLENIVQP